MKFLKAHYEEIVHILVLILVFIMTLIFYRVQQNLSTTVYGWKGYLFLSTLYAVVFFVIARNFDALAIGKKRFFELLFSGVLALITCNILFYAIICLINGRILSPNSILYTTGIQIIISGFIYYIYNRIYMYISPRFTGLVVESKTLNESDYVYVFSKINNFCTIGEVVTEELPADIIIKKLEQYDVLVLGEINFDLRAELARYCFENNKRIIIKSRISDILLKNSQSALIADQMVYLRENTGITMSQSFFKRVFDLVFGVLLFVLFLPFMLIAGIAIKLEDGGPIFYTQERVTQFGRTFNLYKLRSMREVPDEDIDPLLPATVDDMRITKVGKIIRPLHIDEMPQIINILKGDMSIVGPRPEHIHMAKSRLKTNPEYVYRLKMKAGLTGYAQVYGLYTTSAIDKVKLDLTYFENYSLALDFKIILNTAKVMFLPHTSEGYRDPNKAQNVADGNEDPKIIDQ